MKQRVNRYCLGCKRSWTLEFEASDEQVRIFETGAVLVKNIFLLLISEELEALISGFHSVCYDALFGEESK